ncbi:Mn-superoxide dismutase [Scheffersomyces xylosifermentans]|uniref:Mn-superoxide dismutase n=1 Tax=Scheffersomyces xylosifermentans TaxID=1304137 RepID=UPI00315D2EF2
MYRIGSRRLGKSSLLPRVNLSAQRNVSFKLPSILTLENAKNKQEGFNGLFSASTVNELWFKRGQELVQGLNQSLEQSYASNEGVSSAESNNLQDIIAQTIHKPELYGIYCYASFLYNLQFFLESLKESAVSKPLHYGQPSDLLKTPQIDGFGNEPKDEKLREWIIDSFGSIVEFRTLILNSAKAIKGDGLVWLVAESNLSQSVLKNSPNLADPGQSKKPIYNKLAVVNTYNAGVVDDSIRSGQVQRLKQQKEAKIAALKSKQAERESIESGETVAKEIEELQNQVDELTLGSVEDAEFANLFTDKTLLPLLAVDASPRNYLLDYGVFGKQQYLDNVWESIDWDVVTRRLPDRTKQFINTF